MNREILYMLVEVRTVVILGWNAVSLVTGMKHENEFWGAGYKGVLRNSPRCAFISYAIYVYYVLIKKL